MRAAVVRAGGTVRPALALLLTIGCAVAIACGASQPRTAAPPAAAAPAPAESGPWNFTGPRAEIDALDRQVEVGLARAQLPIPEDDCRGPACAQAMSQPFAVPSIGDAKCPAPVPTTRCADVCSYSTGICNNQRRICELAGQLAGDEWAARKCARARVACEQARAACCVCVQ